MGRRYFIDLPGVLSVCAPERIIDRPSEKHCRRPCPRGLKRCRTHAQGKRALCGFVKVVIDFMAKYGFNGHSYVALGVRHSVCPPRVDPIDQRGECGEHDHFAGR